VTKTALKAAEVKSPCGFDSLTFRKEHQRFSFQESCSKMNIVRPFRNFITLSNIVFALTVATFASAQASFDSYWDFQVKETDHETHYNQNAESAAQQIKLPAALTKWNCVRQPLQQSTSNASVVTGIITCSDDEGKTGVAAVVTCKLDAPNADRNTIVLTSDDVTVLLRITCRTIPHQESNRPPNIVNT